MTSAEQTFNHIAKETEKAICVNIKGIDHWIPRSACNINGNKIQIAEWFARDMDDAGAMFSDDKKHRFVLWRIWNKRRPKVLTVGLNPSTANQNKNDPTIDRLVNTLNAKGYGGFYMVNLFTIISSSPEMLLKPEVRNDEDRDMNIIFAYSLGCDDVIFCWGTFEEAKTRAQRLIDFYTEALCFGKNKDGSPWHPMALMYAGLRPKNTRIFKFSEHTFEKNYYDRKDKKKKAEYNAKQYSLLKPNI